jgi:hypothetical protein
MPISRYKLTQAKGITTLNIEENKLFKFLFGPHFENLNINFLKDECIVLESGIKIVKHCNNQYLLYGYADKLVEDLPEDLNQFLKDLKEELKLEFSITYDLSGDVYILVR